MVSGKLKDIFLFVIILFILHSLEEYFTGFYNFDPLLFKPLGQILPITSQAAFVLFQIVWISLLILSYRLKVRRQLLLIVSIFWGIALVLELEHLYRAFSFGGYTPGLVTSLLFPVVGVFYWKELLKNLHDA
ncbi:HXXEE domain-containing protein [Candidatus Microgenomates bacterium]|nr:HXXEE domain-containing protein [Candidatus Microgenomates bacterium]